MTNNYRKLHRIPMKRFVHLRKLYYRYDYRRDVEKYMRIIDKYFSDGNMTWEDVRKIVRGEIK